MHGVVSLPKTDSTPGQLTRVHQPDTVWNLWGVSMENNQLLSTESDLVFAQGNDLLTDSRTVAKAFGKAHKNVLRDIDELLKKSPEFTSAHFWAYVENQKVGIARRNMRGYRMTKDGFMLLVMGFKGEKAFKVKIDYINAFNQMQTALNDLNQSLMTKLLAALEAEKQSFAVASLAGRVLRNRRDEKPENKAKIEQYKAEIQPMLPYFEV